MTVLWLLSTLLALAQLAPAGANSAPIFVFDFDCAQKSEYPTGKLTIEIDSETLHHDVKPWIDRAVRYDLNSDGFQELFVPTFCGATGNCDWAVFEGDSLDFLGKVSGARIYLEETPNPWLQITTYIGSGAGHGHVFVYAMGEFAYQESSTREIVDPENGQFLSEMGHPLCHTFGAVHPN